jgi:hypothetical protein
MSILDDFQRLCGRVVKCKSWWNGASEKEREAQKTNLYILADLLDETFSKMNEQEREEALIMLEVSLEGTIHEGGM